FVPAILLAAFALLCGFLLFYNLSSYLVQSRLRALSEQARFTAETTALEIQRAGGQDIAGILARRQAGLSPQFPEASLAFISPARDCPPTRPVAGPRPPITAGPWAHVDAPRFIPGWIPCTGFSGALAYVHPRSGTDAQEDAHLILRAVAYPDAQ